MSEIPPERSELELHSACVTACQDIRLLSMLGKLHGMPVKPKVTGVGCFNCRISHEALVSATKYLRYLSSIDLV